MHTEIERPIQNQTTQSPTHEPSLQCTRPLLIHQGLFLIRFYSSLLAGWQSTPDPAPNAHQTPRTGMQDCDEATDSTVHAPGILDTTRRATPKSRFSESNGNPVGSTQALSAVVPAWASRIRPTFASPPGTGKPPERPRKCHQPACGAKSTFRHCGTDVTHTAKITHRQRRLLRRNAHGVFEAMVSAWCSKTTGQIV